LGEGLRQIAEGKLIPHEEVKAEFKSWLTGSFWTPIAVQDLRDICDFISRDKPPPVPQALKPNLNPDANLIESIQPSFINERQPRANELTGLSIDSGNGDISRSMYRRLLWLDFYPIGSKDQRRSDQGTG